jgi:hypothetical protein
VLFASLHISSEPQVALTSTPDPGEAALHSQVGRVMYATHGSGQVYPFSTDPHFTAVLDIAVFLHMHTKVLLGTNDMMTTYKEINLRLTLKKNMKIKFELKVNLNRIQELITVHE